MTTPKFEHSEIEEMLENFKSKDWDFMLQSQKKLYAHSPQIISQLLGEVKELKRNLDITQKIASIEFTCNVESREKIQILKEALEYYEDKNGGPYASGDYHTADGGKRAQEALAKLNQVKGVGE